MSSKEPQWVKIPFHHFLSFVVVVQVCYATALCTISPLTHNSWTRRRRHQSPAILYTIRPSTTMTDSDSDYFGSDDLILDADAVAALDETELQLGLTQPSPAAISTQANHTSNANAINSSSSKPWQGNVQQQQQLQQQQQQQQYRQHQYQQQRAQTAISAAPPANKRQKTNSASWRPGLGNQRTPSFEDLDLPDISVREDGTYDMPARSVVSSTTTATTTGNANVNFNATRSGVQPTRNFAAAPPGGTRAPPPSNAIVQQQQQQRHFPQRQGVDNAAAPTTANTATTPSRPFGQSHSANSTSKAHSARPPQAHQRPPFRQAPPPGALQRTPSGQSIPSGSQPADSTSTIVQPQPQPPLSPNWNGTHDAPLLAQMEALRLEVEQLKQEKERMQSDIKDALSARYSKEGEVAILRKGMEKTAHEHAAQLVKLRRDKDEALARETQTQKMMKEEMERIRTQFQFKQHELEANMRRLQVPPSVRAKRIGKDIPATPLRTPSQYQQQHRLSSVHPLGMDMTPFAELPQSTRAAAGRSGNTNRETPRKGQQAFYNPPLVPTLPQTPRSKKKPPHQQHLQRSGRSTKKTTSTTKGGSTPGFTRFHNAFMDSPAPARRPTATPARSRLSSQLAAAGPIPSPPSSPTRHGRVGFRAGVASPLVAEDKNNNSGWPDHGGGHRSSDGFLDGGSEMDMQGPPMDEFDEDEEAAAEDEEDEQIGDEDDEDADEEGVEGNEPFVLLDCRMRLHELIIYHTYQSSTPTLQRLIRAPLSTALDGELHGLYESCCSRLLEVLAAGVSSYPSQNDDDGGGAGWQGDLLIVEECFTQMARILDVADLPVYLAALLDLFTRVEVLLPVPSPLIASPTRHGPNAPSLVPILCEIVRSRGLPKPHMDEEEDEEEQKEGEPNEPPSSSSHENADEVYSAWGQHRPIAIHILDLLLAQLRSITDERAQELSLFARGERVLSILLDASQPTAVLRKTADMLAGLTSFRGTLGSLLPLPPGVSTEEDGKPVDVEKYAEVPMVEQLGALLIDEGRSDEEARNMRMIILTLFSGVATAHDEASFILAASKTLLPSIILMLSQLVTPIFEEDEAVLLSPAKTTSDIRLIHRAMLLLHYVVHSPKEPVALAHLLQMQWPRLGRRFAGILHDFIVTFGRIGYADVPEWLQMDDRDEMERIAETARDLLDLVVDGPDGDGVWFAFQGGEEGDQDGGGQAEEDEEEEKTDE